MNEDDFNTCNMILKLLLNNKLSKMFFKNNNDILNINIHHPFDLEYFQKKLEKKLFKNKDEFINDIIQFFQNISNAYPLDSLRHWASKQYLNDFLNYIQITESKIYPISTSLYFITNNYLKYSNIPNSKNLNNNNFNKLPGSIIFNQNFNNIFDINILSRDIKLLSSNNMAAKITSFIKKLQPEVLNTKYSISIHISLLNQENLKKLKNFINNLLLEAAQEKIIVFNRPFGKKINPIKINIIKKLETC